MKKLLSLFGLLLAAMQQLSAQCAMCKASAETSMESSTQAAGVNTGVLYVLFFVFITLMFFVFLFFKGTSRNNS